MLIFLIFLKFLHISTRLAHHHIIIVVYHLIKINTTNILRFNELRTELVYSFIVTVVYDLFLIYKFISIASTSIYGCIFT